MATDFVTVVVPGWAIGDSDIATHLQNLVNCLYDFREIFGSKEKYSTHFVRIYLPLNMFISIVENPQTPEEAQVASISGAIQVILTEMSHQKQGHVKNEEFIKFIMSANSHSQKLTKACEQGIRNAKNGLTNSQAGMRWNSAFTVIESFRSLHKKADTLQFSTKEKCTVTNLVRRAFYRHTVLIAMGVMTLGMLLGCISQIGLDTAYGMDTRVLLTNDWSRFTLVFTTFILTSVFFMVAFCKTMKTFHHPSLKYADEFTKPLLAESKAKSS